MSQRLACGITPRNCRVALIRALVSFTVWLSPTSLCSLTAPYRPVLLLHPFVDPPDPDPQFAGDADLAPALVPQARRPLSVEGSLPGADLAAACPCRPHPGPRPLPADRPLVVNQ